ncbi:MAG: ArnT family glycosyltransferase [Microgenomates group bacterium]
MRNFLRKNIIEILIFCLLIIGFLLRINGLSKNYSFWTDEASTARFARGILETGFPQIPYTGYKENSYFITHYLTALSFLIFGVNEFSGRLPEIIFGSILILITYIFGEKVFNKLVGLGGATLTTFSYIQIAWSRQARGYVILEVFYLLALLNFYLFVKEKRKLNLFLFLIFAFISVWVHTLGLIIFLFGFIYILFRKDILSFLIKNKFFILLLLGVILLLFFGTNFFPVFKVVFRDKILNLNINKNFLFYYHSLFWRQYSLISFLSLLGLIILWFKNEKKLFHFLLVFIIIYLFSISFLIGVSFEKYALNLFPIFFILTSFTLWEISRIIGKKQKTAEVLFIFLILFIVINGNKFSLKPKSFYTLNFDMREIPEIDYKGIYKLIKEKSGEKINEVALVDISHDIPAWYLGEGKNLFIPRNDVSLEKKINENSGGIFIHNLDEFKELLRRYPQGFVVIIEHNFRFYPAGLVDYVRKNLDFEKKEEVAWFSLDWNKWPIELYSWGFK